MATRSTVGYEDADGGYVGVYCHYDGYPENMGPNLHRMFHADVVIMVSKALRQGGIRCINNDGTYEIFNDKGYAAETTWPCCPEEFAYRKRLDGRVEWTNDRWSFKEWTPNEP
jgi:hypothetical protein